eukprot:4874546-Pleurochrysis_carterae.AAC.4
MSEAFSATRGLPQGATVVRWNAFLKGLDLEFGDDGLVTGLKYPATFDSVRQALDLAERHGLLVQVVLATAHFLRCGWGGARHAAHHAHAHVSTCAGARVFAHFLRSRVFAPAHARTHTRAGLNVWGAQPLTRTRMRACSHTCAYACSHQRAHMPTRPRAHAHTRTRTRAHARTRASARMRAHAYARTHQHL